MNLWAPALLVTGVLCAQETPAGVLRGTLIERDDAQIAVRGPDNRVERLRYDARTRAEREGRTVDISELLAGDTVEVAADRGARPNERYARTVKVLQAVAAPRSRQFRRNVRTAFIDETFPRGNLIFAGIVSEVAPGSFIVRTRERGPQRILLRDDTRYLGNGGQVAASDLAVNTRVFVRAGKNYAGEIEAYQIVWGAILQPDEQ